MELLTKEAVYNLGVSRGFSCSQGVEWLFPGKKLPKEIAAGVGFEYVRDLIQSELVFYYCARVNEMLARTGLGYSNLVNRMNNWEKKADFKVWEEFNLGLEEGMRLFWLEIYSEIKGYFKDSATGFHPNTDVF